MEKLSDVKKSCGRDHKNCFYGLSNIDIDNPCPRHIYEVAYKLGYNAAFARFENRVENIINRWNVISPGESYGESTKSQAKSY